MCSFGAPSWFRGAVLSWYARLYLRERDKRYVRESVGVWSVAYTWITISGTYICNPDDGLQICRNILFY